MQAPEGETQPSTEVDLFISTEKIMVLNTDLKEIMMDHTLRTISYIADIGDLVVLMARRRPGETDGMFRLRRPVLLLFVVLLLFFSLCCPRIGKCSSDESCRPKKIHRMPTLTERRPSRDVPSAALLFPTVRLEEEA